MLSRDQTLREIEHNRAVFLGLARTAERSLELGRYDDAGALAQLAAGFASGNHPGTFASPSLERTLAAIGAATLSAISSRSRDIAAGWPRRVLHVMTQAMGVGGHTRYAMRWINHDSDRAHSVALTRQRGPVPAGLAEAVTAGGGELTTIAGQGGLVRRAADLRELLAEFDALVIYSHAFDVVPVIALSGPGARPPSLFVNHSDHCFWLGTATADLVASIRPVGLQLCTQRRGIAAERCAVVPLPLDATGRRRTREEAKAELGLPASAIVLLTVAHAYKYEPIDEVDFLDLVTPVLASHADTLLFAIGPSGHRWRRAARRWSDRVRVPGPQSDLQLYYEACDIYLDSYPVSSVTSLLEAASLGVPAVTLCPYGPGGDVLCAEDVGLDDLETRAGTPDRFTAMVEEMVVDAGLRSRTGAATADRIIAAHDPERWTAAIESLFRRLADVAPTRATSGPAEIRPDPLQVSDELLLRALDHPLLQPGLFPAAYRARDVLPSSLRVSTWANLVVDQAVRKVVPRSPIRHQMERRYVRRVVRITR